MFGGGIYICVCVRVCSCVRYTVTNLYNKKLYTYNNIIELLSFIHPTKQPTTITTYHQNPSTKNTRKVFAVCFVDVRLRVSTSSDNRFIHWRSLLIISTKPIWLLCVVVVCCWFVFARLKWCLLIQIITPINNHF